MGKDSEGTQDWKPVQNGERAEGKVAYNSVGKGRIDETSSREVSPEWLPYVKDANIEIGRSEKKIAVKALRDTGAARTIIRPNLIPDLEGESIGQFSMVLAGGVTKSSPLVRMSLELEGQTADVEVGVAEIPVKGIDVLLGNDIGKPVPIRLNVDKPLPELTHTQNDGSRADMADPVALITRSQAKKAREEEQRGKLDLDPLLDHIHEDASSEESQHRRGEVRLTTNEGGAEGQGEEPLAEEVIHGMAMGKEELIRLQHEDPGLEDIRRSVEKEEKNGRGAFIVENGVILRRHRTPDKIDSSTEPSTHFRSRSLRALETVATTMPSPAEAQAPETTCSVLHHVEICVGDTRRTLDYLIKSFDFDVTAVRETPSCRQWVLRHASSLFVVTKRKDRQSKSKTKEEEEEEDNLRGGDTECERESPPQNAKSEESTNGFDHGTGGGRTAEGGGGGRGGGDGGGGGRGREELTEGEPSIGEKKAKTQDKQGTPSDFGVSNGDSSSSTTPSSSSLRLLQTSSFSSPQHSLANHSHSSIQISSSISTNQSPSNSEHWTVFCCRDQEDHVIDSVFNVALVVKDVDVLTERVRAKGGEVLREPCDIKDEFGVVRYAIVGSCCGNVVHTLLDKQGYSGEFLPGFCVVHGDKDSTKVFQTLEDLDLGTRRDSKKLKTNTTSHEENGNSSGPSLVQTNGSVSSPGGCSKKFFTHTDHLTLVCRRGESVGLLQWYEDCLGMRRFITNRHESPTEGFVMDEPICLRLKALEYWRCAETGIASPGSKIGDASLKLVVAESLPGTANSQVETFLTNHGGPGVQHIGLHTSRMTSTVDALTIGGVSFRKPPPPYYEECGKRGEIEAVGLGYELEDMRRLGILLDTEDDVLFPLDDRSHRYLMQIFAFPMFKEDTFFLEVIQRCGAKGFGAGNIRALAISIVLHQQQLLQEEKKKEGE
ncbi:uncharacterized protein LOC143041839 [Oratosquilla oratoria]|uniref:uncharacterized protein LOC143041839 n=1 Tax=Oratosquilla oratoria TaxID=337810 RepID=UPI003F76BEB5